MNPYPTCKLHHMPQRSPEWFDVRRGHLTASQFGEWLTKTGKVAESARLTAASKVLAEMAGYPDPPPFVNDDMQRGIDLEPEARKLFRERTGMPVTEIGFASSIHGYFGCSPDGLTTNDNSGIEIKIPRASKLIQYHENGELPAEYRAQVHGSMAVLGCRKYHFFAWHPGFPPFHIVEEWTTYTSEMLEGLKSFSNYFASLVARMKERANAEDLPLK
jgi:putative phage-type endonuclease